MENRFCDMVSLPMPGVDYTNVLQFIEITWKSLANCVDRLYQTGTELITCLPHFNKFDQQDQISLIERKGAIIFYREGAVCL